MDALITVTRRGLLRGAAVGTPTALLAACGAGGVGGGQASPKLEPTTIEYWHFAVPGGVQALAREEGVRKFMAKVPEIKVTVSSVAPSGAMLEKFKSVAAGGGAVPDAVNFQATWRPDLVASKLVTSLEPLIKSRPQGFSRDAFLPDAITTLSSDGQLYGIPRLVVTSLVYYNKDLFARLDIPAPTENWTFEREFAEAARKLTREVNGEQAYATDFPNELRDTLVYAWGGEFFDKTFRKSLLDQGPAISGLEFAYDLRWKRRVLTTPESEKAMVARTMFLTGRIGMYMRGNYELGNMLPEKPSFQIGVALTPKGPAGRRQFGQLDFNGIPEGSTKKAAAWEFLKWQGGDEGQQHLVDSETLTPATKKAYPSPTVAADIWRTFTEANKTAIYFPPVRNFPDVNTAINTELGTALNDNARGVADAARAAAAAATQHASR